MDVLQKIIDNCDAGDSGMDKCADAGPINDSSDSCSIANLVPEKISGVLEKLPGNNPQLDRVKARAHPLVHPIRKVPRLPPVYCLHLRPCLPHVLKSILQTTVSSAGHILAVIPTISLLVRSL